MPNDSSMTVVIKKTGKDSTAKQRGLQWMWFGEIAESGLGSEDTKDDVHLKAKWKFARPIFLRDSELFGAVFAGFELMVKDYDFELKRACYKEFTQDYIKTEYMNKAQRAEFLTNLQDFWLRKGVNLSDPARYGLDDNFNIRKKDKQNGVSKPSFAGR